MTRPRRLLTLSHSYVVRLNRRLAHELARQGGGRWDVTAVAPDYFHGGHDLRPVTFEPADGEPCRVEVVPARLTWWPHLFFFARRLRQILRPGAFDLVHAWEEPYIVAGAQIASAVPAGVPLVFASFQNLAKRYVPPFNWVERYAMRRASGWIALAQTAAETLGTRPGYAGKPSRVIPVGVDTARFAPDAAARDAVRRSLGWDAGGAPVVGFLGRLTPEKGVRVLTAALDAVAATATPWRALFVGTGPLESELRAWAARHGDRVRLCTDVRHDGVPAHLNAMDVLAAPSLTTPQWREQFGRMLIEAFACGVPVIGSDSGEIPHVLGDAGAVVPEGDVAAWARQLAAALDDPAWRAARAAAGMERARARYDWPVVAREHLDFFDELLQAGPQS